MQNALPDRENKKKKGCHLLNKQKKNDVRLEIYKFIADCFLHHSYDLSDRLSKMAPATA